MDVKKLTADEKVDRLLIALHDAIRRPMGVVPKSAELFVNEKEMRAAEARRLDYDSCR